MKDDLSLGQRDDAARFLAAAKAERPQVIQTINCEELDCHSWQNWCEVGEAMSRASVLPMGQAWLAQDEPGFAPGAIALAHHGDELIIYAELDDLDIFNPIREHGVHAYNKGDVFEIFLRAEGQRNYFEHHITPYGHTLQLSFPTLSSFEKSNFADPDWSKPFATTIPVITRILIQPEIATWRLLAMVPLRSITSSCDATLPMTWRFSICRYDHTQGHVKPVLSSTTPYRFPNFHHQEQWGTFSLA